MSSGDEAPRPSGGTDSAKPVSSRGVTSSGATTASSNPGGAPVSLADIELVDFGKGDGLLPAVVQHACTGAVLMLGYMNSEALRETFSRRRVVFFSRSKQRLWEKGESSGHFLELAGIRTDCDRDTLLVTAWPHGPVCHVGTATCFGDEPVTTAERLAFLGTLESVIAQRATERPEGSYTAHLFAQGPRRIAQKVGEEGLEVALAAVVETDDKVISESADLLFHLLVMLKSRGLPLERVVAELRARHAEP
jgi:phosphoribosyl-AMP cyclohydrolase / phosphoribosyl-ATP pyrophosphohydrolase